MGMILSKAKIWLEHNDQDGVTGTSALSSFPGDRRIRQVMPANSNAQPALDEIQSAAAASTAKFEQALDELKERANKVAQETISTLKTRAETFKTQAEPYVSDAGERLAVAERYLVERVQKQPLTTTLAVLGIGVLVGLVLASGRSSR